MSETGKEKTNLHLPTRVKFLSSQWAEANGTNLSALVDSLLRSYLEEKGINCDIPIDEFVDRISSKAALQKAAKKDEDLGAQKKQSGLHKLKESLTKKK